MKDKIDIYYLVELIWRRTDNRIIDRIPPFVYFKIVLSLLFMRRIDCMIGKYAKDSQDFYLANKDRFSDDKMFSGLQTISGGYPFYNVSGLNFDLIISLNNTINILVERYIQGFSDNVKDILDGMHFRDNMARLGSEYYAELLFRTFRDIDLSESAVDNESLLEMIYSLMNRLEGGHDFLYATPSPLATLMTEVLFQQLVPGRKDDSSISIYDPVCGTGTLLAKAYCKAIFRLFNRDNISLCGQDIDVDTSSIAKAFALLLGNEQSEICHGDTLANDMLPDRKFDFILADMPFRVSWKHIQPYIEQESFLSGSRFTAGLPNVNDSQFLFIEHMVSKMNPSGSRIVFVTTGSVLWIGDAKSGESRIRRWLFENDLIESIIALPNGVHRLAFNIPLYLWVITNKKEEKRKGKTLLVNASDFLEGNLKKSQFNYETISQILHFYKNCADTHHSKLLSNDQFGYYEISYYEKGDKKKKTVSFGLNTKVDEYFKTNVFPFAKGEVTIDYSSVEKGYAIDFNKFFEKETETVSLQEISSKNILPLLDTFSTFNKDVETIKKIEITSEEEIKEYTSSWVEYPLNYLASIINGAAKPKNQDGHGLPLLTISYLRDQSCDVEKYECPMSDEKVVGENDVLLASKGANVGEVFKGIKGIASNTLTIIRSQSNVISPKYLYYLLKGYENNLRSNSKGAGVPSLDTKAVSVMKYLLPPVRTQESIVSFLEPIDTKVDFINNVMGNKNNVFSSYRQAIIEAAVKGKLKIS